MLYSEIFYLTNTSAFVKFHHPCNVIISVMATNNNDTF